MKGGLFLFPALFVSRRGSGAAKKGLPLGSTQRVALGQELEGPLGCWEGSLILRRLPGG